MNILVSHVPIHGLYFKERSPTLLAHAAASSPLTLETYQQKKKIQKKEISSVTLTEIFLLMTYN